MSKAHLLWSALCLAAAGASPMLLAEREPAAVPDSGYLVTLQLSVDETGRVTKAAVKETDDALLDELAMDMVKKWQLKPRIKDGGAVKYEVLAPIKFPVEGDGGAAAKKQPVPTITKIWEPPQYPRELLRKSVTGGAIIDLQISAKGKLKTAKVRRASHPQFGQNALDTVRTWRFAPAKQDNEPVDSKCSVAVVFLLEEAQPPALEWFLAPRPCLDRFTISGSRVR